MTNVAGSKRACYMVCLSALISSIVPRGGGKRIWAVSGLWCWPLVCCFDRPLVV